MRARLARVSEGRGEGSRSGLALLARAIVLVVGALALAMGVVGVVAGQLIAAAAALVVGGVLLAAALVRGGEKARALVAEHPQLRWGALLVVPPLLIIVGCRLAHFELPEAWFAGLALAIAAGMFILFRDLG